MPKIRCVHTGIALDWVCKEPVLHLKSYHDKWSVVPISFLVFLTFSTLKPDAIPAIPDPPTSPRLSELEHFDLSGSGESQHPIYAPNTTKYFASHWTSPAFIVWKGSTLVS